VNALRLRAGAGATLLYALASPAWADTAHVQGADNVVIQGSPGASVGAVNNYTVEVRNTVSSTSSTTVINSTTIKSTLDMAKFQQLLSKELAPLASKDDVNKALTERLEQIQSVLNFVEDLRDLEKANAVANGDISKRLHDIDEKLDALDFSAVEARRQELEYLTTRLKRAGKQLWLEASFDGELELFGKTHRRGLGPRLSIAYDVRLSDDTSLYVGVAAGYSLGSLKIVFLDPAGNPVTSSRQRQDDERWTLLGSLGFRFARTSLCTWTLGVSGGPERYVTDPDTQGWTWRLAMDPHWLIWLNDFLLLSVGVDGGFRGPEPTEQRYSGFGADLQHGTGSPQFFAGIRGGLTIAGP
jgi:hypothetical protein